MECGHKTCRVPNTTHRYLIESISESLHPKVMLASRYIGFVKSLCSSPKYCMRVLASTIKNDMRTVMGRTLNMISVECTSPKDSLTSAIVKKNMKYFPVPDTEQWRVGILSERLSDTVEIPGFASEEIEDIKSFICTS